MIARPEYRKEIEDSLAQFRITALLGPRQCGKTTLARTFAGQSSTYFDLEDPLDLARLDMPRLALDRLRGLVVIDEIQLRPDLFPLLRVLADRPDNPARFLILGSAAPELVKGIAESLAGRVGFVDMGGFDLHEAGSGEWERLWLRGGFPESFLGRSDVASWRWREQFIRTFLTRDIPQLEISIPAEQLRRFWRMIAHYHGQLWNSSEIAASLGVTHKTAQRYLDILAGAFMLRVLPPWSENMGKRLRKAPKIHFRDSGAVPQPARRSFAGGTARASQTGSLMGGLCARTSVAVVACLARRNLPLGHARRGGIGSVVGAPRAALGLRGEIRRRAPHHQVDAQRHGKPATGKTLRDLSGGAGLCAR